MTVPQPPTQDDVREHLRVALDVLKRMWGNDKPTPQQEQVARLVAYVVGLTDPKKASDLQLLFQFAYALHDGKDVGLIKALLAAGPSSSRYQLAAFALGAGSATPPTWSAVIAKAADLQASEIHVSYKSASSTPPSPAAPPGSSDKEEAEDPFAFLKDDALLADEKKSSRFGWLRRTPTSTEKASTTPADASGDASARM